ncbi:MAG: radical SAM protein [bacterium]|nr:radical SAM protein [bacterium]
MRALLFNPWITDFSAFDHWTRPLNLLRLASLLRRTGWELSFYDCLDRLSPDLDGLRAPRHRLNPFGCGHYYREDIPSPEPLRFVPRVYKRYGVPPGRVEASLRAMPEPDLVVIPCMMTYWYPGAYEAIAMARRLFPRAAIVLGGVYATLCTNHAREHAGADAVIVGAHWFDCVNQINRLMGVNETLSGSQGDWIEPEYEWLRGHFCFPILLSTGCPCHCTYCATHSLWPKHLVYPPEAVIGSLDRLVNEYGATDVAFYDDALLVKKADCFVPVMEEVLRRGWRLRFHAPNALHVRRVDRDTAALLKRVGFTTIRLGLEVAQREMQRSTGGKVYTEEYIRCMQWLREAGFSAREVGTYLLLGLPGQSIGDVEDACRIVHESGSEIKIASYSPLPDTPLFDADMSEYHFDPRNEPLLQNNSLAPWRSERESEPRVQAFQRMAHEWNHRLREAAPARAFSVS